jgi:hypothetical protein
MTTGFVYLSKAAFAWGTRVFEWLGTLATWLFSGEWRE